MNRIVNKKHKGYVASISNPNLRTYFPNQIIIREGQLDDGNIFILQKGSLAVLLNNEKVAEINEHGAFIGEMSTILRRKRTATIKTICECQISVYGGGLERIIEKFPAITSKLLLQLAFRLQKTTSREAELLASLKNAEAKYDKLRKEILN
jgi:CRP-like cAMP-binding protein